jgi:DNA polymerase I-like protein with 3'-5' exonuclease and polymerase domains
LHCHDEIVVECDSKDAEKTIEHLREIMCIPPEWAKGIPLNIDIHSMQRYGK